MASALFFLFHASEARPSHLSLNQGATEIREEFGAQTKKNFEIVPHSFASGSPTSRTCCLSRRLNSVQMLASRATTQRDTPLVLRTMVTDCLEADLRTDLRTIVSAYRALTFEVASTSPWQ